MWPFDQNNQSVYQQYSQAYDTGNYNSVDPSQAVGHVQQFMANAPDDMQQQLYTQHFSQMPYEHRALLAQRMPPQYAMDINDPSSMAQSFWRLGREQPHLLPRILDHPILLATGVGLAGLVAKHIMHHHHHNSYGQQPYGYDQGGYQQGGYQQGGYQQNQYLQQELAQEQQREQQLRYQIQDEERRIEQLEERGQYHHHHRREDDF